MAMQEELITQEDFDQIKVAFLKAQQIKAGLDAGFIREADYIQARDSFLHSLDFRTAMTHHAPSAAAAPAPMAPPPPPLNFRAAVPPLSQAAISGGGLTSRAGSSNMLVSNTPRSASPTACQGGLPAPFSNTVRPAPASTSGGGTVAVPVDLPRIGKANVSAGKVRVLWT